MSKPIRRILLFALVLATPAYADEPYAKPAPPPPYAAPFQLRPTGVANVFRSDNVAAFYSDDTGSGSTVVTSLLAGYKVSPELAPFARFAVLHDDPTSGDSATGNSNALVGLTWAPKLPAPFRIGVIGAMTVPIGSGGGNSPEMAKAAANRAAIYARSGMDNAMFAVNDLALIGGASVAYVDRGVTVQAEMTLFQLFRVRAEDTQPDERKTNMTSGLSVGYFVIKQLSLGAELRYQRWLSTPKAVANDMTSTLRDTLSAAAGARGHFKLEGARWLRPGISYGRGVDDPMTNRHYQIVQIDVLFAY
jgi:hypothetical protein